MNLDSRTSKARMKKISINSGFCEWESGIYFISFIIMNNQLTERLEDFAVWANEPLHIDKIYRFLATNSVIQELIRRINTIIL